MSKTLRFLLQLLGLSLFSASAFAVDPGWIVKCPYSHSLPDDPIVAPGVPGGSHLHDFSGANDANADSTYATMQSGGTSCSSSLDTAGYWVPALYRNGVHLPYTDQVFNGRRLDPKVYYRKNNLNSGTQITAFPPNFKMVAGNAHAANASENPKLGSALYYGCSDNSTGKLKVPPSSCPTGIMTIHVGFPNCWDGVSIDSANHQSHVKYPSGGVCPSSHPVALPRVIQRFEYPTGSPTGTITLSSGGTWTIHGDFWNTWDQPALEGLVEDCLNASVNCTVISD